MLEFISNHPIISVIFAFFLTTIFIQIIKYLTIAYVNTLSLIIKKEKVDIKDSEEVLVENFAKKIFKENNKNNINHN